ncbi:MAG: hypothetical protein HYR96_06160 [Deltaproteobacteria bacterium]|nr:hypothetical protein [Deltaproteobacteria bacterium]
MTFLLMHQTVALAGELIVIWPGLAHTGAVQIKAFVRKKSELALRSENPQRVVMEKRVAQGVTEKVATVTPF